MTNLALWVGSCALLVSVCVSGWMAWRQREMSRRLGLLEEGLRGTPVSASPPREPAPGSYSLSDAEAALVEHDQLQESRQRAVTRRAAGSGGSNASWRKG